MRPSRVRPESRSRSVKRIEFLLQCFADYVAQFLCGRCDVVGVAPGGWIDRCADREVEALRAREDGWA